MKAFMEMLSNTPGAIKGPIGVLVLFLIYWLAANLLGETPMSVLFITMLMLFLTGPTQKKIESLERWYKNRQIDASSDDIDDIYSNEDSFGKF